MNQDLAEKLSFIVHSALNKKELRGIVDVLKNVAEAVNAYGCILWVKDPSTNLKNTTLNRSLYVFADWFDEGGGEPIRELPIKNSANGLAITSEKILNIESLQTDARTTKGDYSVHQVKLTSMCIIPIKFDSDQTNATLSVYRREKVSPFTLEEQNFIEQVARVIPSLYQSICDKVGHFLLSDIHRILDEPENEVKLFDANIDQITQRLQKVCEKLSETFQCIETSLFLENRLTVENRYELIATTFSNWKGKKKIYLPSKEEGLTGWVLENKRPVRIFNLSHFNKEKKNLRREYKGIDWKDSLKLKPNARKYLELPAGSLLPPLSFVAVPVVKDGELLGVIRCCTAKRSPWFFSNGQLELLKLVAVQIGRVWSDCLQHLEENEENKTWKSFVANISNLNAKVRESLNRGNVDEAVLYKQMLELAGNSISRAESMSIKLRSDGEIQEIFASDSLTSDWMIGTKITTLQGIENELSLHQSSYNEELLSVKNSLSESSNPEEELTIPISVQNEMIGVINIRASRPFLPNAARIAELLGQQLGLYLSLFQNEKQQRQVFEDLWHQLKSPVGQVFARARGLVQGITYKNWHTSDLEIVDEIRTEVLMLRSIARKTKRVAVNAGVFTNLSTHGYLNLNPRAVGRLFSGDAIRMLTEGYKDTEILQDTYDISFFLNGDSFRKLEEIRVLVDYDFLEQAVNCLLDNANKYSFKDTAVVISGSEVIQNGQHYFGISIRNQGLGIKEVEIPQLKLRGYRGFEAKMVTGEGSGIGLWVVDHIMRAHGGQLEIIPTTSEGWTEMRLVFPVSIT